MARKIKERVASSEAFSGIDGLRAAILNAREKVASEGEDIASVGMSGYVTLVWRDSHLFLKITEE